MENKEIISDLQSQVEALQKTIEKLKEPEIPPLPEGYEYVEIGEVVTPEFMYLKHSTKDWEITPAQFIDRSTIHKYWIKPIKKAYDPEWWTKGNTVLYSDGYTSIPSDTGSYGYQQHGRIFESRDQAEEYSDWEVKNASRLRHLQKVEKRIAELNNGWVPDFKDFSEKKFYIYLNRETNTEFPYVGLNTSQSHIQNEAYCKTREIADQIIKEFGEDFLKAAFGWQ